jgi:sugar transferase (PEP-CTERM/EpsH1 system associated)
MSQARHMLFISHRLPYPPNKGETIRAWNFLRHFATDWTIHCGCLCDQPVDPRHADTVREVCAELACFRIDKRWQKAKSLLTARPGRPLMLDYYHHAGLRAWARDRLAGGRIDLAFVFSTAMAPYVLPGHRPPVVLDMVDVDSEKWREYAAHSRGPMRLVWAREARTLLAYERRAAAAADLALLVSEPECRRLETLAPELAGRVRPVENGVDLAYFAPESGLPSPYAGAARRCVFAGTMDYWPNADAAIWFAGQVLPLLRAHDPAVQFIVVGANPSPPVRALAGLPGVTVTGRVPDIRPYVAHADVAVAPLRIARGIQNKVLEAMALGTPVVASPQAFEGVRAIPGQDLLVADGADATARAIMAVLAGEHADLRAAGRRAMERHHGWPAALARLDGLMAPLIAQRARMAGAAEMPT